MLATLILQDEQFPATEVESPLPGGIAEVVRFFFNVPQWIQIAGFFFGVAVAIVLAILIWRRRKGIWSWFLSRPEPLKIGLAIGAVTFLMGIAGFGAISWNYMQHDNDFCTGCHVMASPFQRFEGSGHVDLSCHDCHRQSIFASARQLYLWVAERPVEIAEHSPVPNEICAACHIKAQPDTISERIISTAGHRIHLESADTTLTDVLCVTCHGVEVHEFAPATVTCAQSGCHDDKDIRLGRMAGQTTFHCVVCHKFTAEVAESAPLDSAGALMVAGRRACLSCHLMEERVAGLIPEAEPHDAGCGLCHDPHEQTAPSDAFATCADGGCHSGYDTIPLHQEVAPPLELADCAACHGAHDWHVANRACLACHGDIVDDANPITIAANGRARESRPASLPPLSARSPSHTSSEGESIRAFLVRAAQLLDMEASRTDSLVLDRSESFIATGSPVLAVQAASRPLRHSEHRDVDCVACHSTGGPDHGAVMISSQTDCLACHHGTPAPAACDDCHSARSIAGTRPQLTRFAFSVWDSTTARELPFDHRQHPNLECDACHTSSLTFTVSTTCTDCHDDHHAPERSCMSCHRAEREEPHTLDIHNLGCGGSDCHADAMSYTTMERSRNFCLTCHWDQTEHEEGKVCAECHKVPDITGS